MVKRVLLLGWDGPKCLEGESDGEEHVSDLLSHPGGLQVRGSELAGPGATAVNLGH